MKVLAYNIWAGGRGGLDRVAGVIRRERPDAVALTEATESAVGELAGALGMEGVSAPSNAQVPRSLGLRVAWLTNEPPDRAVVHPLPALSKALLEIELDGTTLFVTHLASRHEEDTHPRRAEMDAILGVLGPLRGPHLLAGDLNAVAPGDPVGQPPPGVVPRGDALPGAHRDVLARLIAAGYTDCYRALNRVAGYTYPADAPWLRLDYLFASPAIAGRLRAAYVVAAESARRASDHLPVVAEFD